MISEVLLLLAGHQSSLFADDNSIHPAFTPLLHPGEQQCLEALSLTAHRYRYIKMACARLSRSNSRYVSALCATLTQILRDEYEALVILTEAKVLQQDSSLVARGSLVPLSSIRATFSEWDAPLIALHALTEQLKAENSWRPGPLIDLLIARARTGVHSVSRIFTKLSAAVQRVWRTQLIALMVHGTRAPTDPLAGEDYTLVQDAMPACVSTLTRDSIVYVSRAVGTVKSARWQKQLPRTLAADYTQMLEGVLPEDQFAFDRVVAEIRANVGEWLWLNVLTRKDVEDAVDSL
jgi:gamma-tubulin complex component 4